MVPFVHSAAWPSPWRFDAPGPRALVLALSCLLCACPGEREGAPASGEQPRPDETLVQLVAERDDVSPQRARQYIEDVRRMAAAARKQQGVLDPLDEERREHVRRAARARVWLDEDFEPRHRPQDIPSEHPLLQQALGDLRLFHPRLHIVCQLVAKPAQFEDRDDLVQRAAEPGFKQRAQKALEPVAQRVQRYVPTGDPEACQLANSLMRWMKTERDGVRIDFEQGAFDLDACAKTAPDGSCIEPALAPEWTEQVRAAQAPGFLPPFETRFGWHLVYVREIAEAHEPPEAEKKQEAAQHIHPKWRAEAFDAYLDQLRKQASVKIAETLEVEGAP